MLGGSPLERNVSNCTHVIVCLLIAWNVCLFLTPLQVGTHHKIVSSGKNLN